VSDSTVDRPIVDAEQAKPVEGETPEVSRPERAHRMGFRSRFAVVYLALAVVAGAAIGSFVVLLAEPDPAPPAAWSKLDPTGSPGERLFTIINAVPPRYRGGDGRQLVTASVSSLQTSTILDGQNVTLPVQRIELEQRGKVHVLDASGSLQFTLCGRGEGCAIDTGKPSEQRYVLLQRAALELALYAFKYVDGVETVTVFLPPSRVTSTDPATQGTVQQTAVFLQRKNVLPELQRPLAETLGTPVPALDNLPQAEIAELRRVTVPNTFRYAYRQAQDGSVVLALEPPALGS